LQLPCFDNFDFNLYPLRPSEFLQAALSNPIKTFAFIVDASRSALQILSRAPRPFQQSMPAKQQQQHRDRANPASTAAGLPQPNAMRQEEQYYVAPQPPTFFPSPVDHPVTFSSPGWEPPQGKGTSSASPLNQVFSPIATTADSPEQRHSPSFTVEPRPSPSNILQDFGQPGLVALCAADAGTIQSALSRATPSIDKLAFLHSSMSSPSLVDCCLLSADTTVWPSAIVCFNAKALFIAGLNVPTGVKVFDLQVAAWILASDTEFATLASCKSLVVGVSAPELNMAARLQFMLERQQTFQTELLQRRQLELFETIEMPVVSLLASMTIIGISVDVDRLTAAKTSLTTRIAELQKEAQQMVGQKLMLSSSVQLREVLYTKLKLGRGVIVPKTAKGQLSTNEDALTKLLGKHPLPAMVLEYRHCCKLLQTYIDGVLPYLQDGQVHADWNQVCSSAS
jgi:hypothetical protein